MVKDQNPPTGGSYPLGWGRFIMIFVTVDAPLNQERFARNLPL